MGRLVVVCAIVMVGDVLPAAGFVRGYSSPSFDHAFFLALLSLLFLFFARYAVHFPSGATWHPALSILMIAMFFAPPTVVTLVAVPGILFVNFVQKSRPQAYFTSIAHIAWGLFLGGMTYHWLILHIHRFGGTGTILGVVIALTVHLIVNRLLAAMFIATKHHRNIMFQVKAILRDLHTGYMTSYLVTMMATLLTFMYGWPGVVFGTLVQLGLFRYMKFHRAMLEWQDMALTDGLTKLRNRAAWDAFVTLHEERTVCGSLAVIDVDQFKEINDSQGHSIGDAVLKDLSAHLLAAFPIPGHVYRLGGDEFVLFYPHDEDEDISLVFRLNDILCCVSDVWKRQGVSLSASIGVSMMPRDAMKISDALSQADQAMYRHKRDARQHSDNTLTSENSASL